LISRLIESLGFIESSASDLEKIEIVVIKISRVRVEVNSEKLPVYI